MTRPRARLALGPVVLTLALRLAWVAVVSTPPRWDGEIYARLARHIAAGEGYVDGFPMAHPTAFYPVGYPAAIAATSMLTRDIPRAAITVNMLAAVVACFAAVALGQRYGGDPVGRLAGVLYAVLPGSVLWTGATMTETLHGALLALACAAATLRSPSARWLTATGIITGIATLVRPQAIVTAPLLGALSARGTPLQRLTRAGIVSLVALAVVAPWTARNCPALDTCAFVSTNGGSNLLIGTYNDARGGYRRPIAANGCNALSTEHRRDACMQHLAIARIHAHPWTWLVGAVPKLARTLAWEHDPVTYLRRDHPALARPLPYAVLVTLCTLAWWTLVLLAIHGATRTGRVATLPLSIGCAVLASHAVFLGADRYHLALVPLLCPLAGVGVMALRGRV